MLEVLQEICAARESIAKDYNHEFAADCICTAGGMWREHDDGVWRVYSFQDEGVVNKTLLSGLEHAKEDYS
jgi:hypothetical protein